MIDTLAMERDFIARRKQYNEELRLNQSGKRTVHNHYPIDEVIIEDCKPFRLKEEPLNENPELLIITYNNGKGAMVIDQEELMKLPKANQNKIFNLHKI